MFDVEDALEADTDERGKIEDACHLAAKAIINEPCGGYDRNPMLVAITNRFVFFNIHYVFGFNVLGSSLKNEISFYDFIGLIFPF